MVMAVRSFLAIRLNPLLKKELTFFQNRLKQEIGPNYRWVNPELLHLTLKFLGDTSSEQLFWLESPLQKLGANTASFHLSLGGLGAFPGKKRPRVLWIGVQEGAAEIINLSLAIEKIVIELQPFLKEKPLKIVPHLTLARQKNTDFYFPPLLFEKKWVCQNKLWVDRFVLMKSTLHPSGPVYHPMKEFLLK